VVRVSRDEEARDEDANGIVKIKDGESSCTIRFIAQMQIVEIHAPY
jgi:hypothetical protein